MKKLYLLLSLLIGFSAFSQQSPSQILSGKLVRISPKLSDLKSSVGEAPRVKSKEELDFEERRKRINKRAKFSIDNPSAKSIDEAIQKSATSNFGLTPNALSASFEGSGTVDNTAVGFGLFTPPDPVMSVGPNHVVQMINSVHKVYNKTGTVLTGPLKFSAIAATSTDDGDPITLYDHIADRWVLLQFSSLFTNGNESLIFCISQTNDPTGSYFVYEFPTTGIFPDYPHVGIWNNSYVVTTHNFNTQGTAYLGQGYWAFDRAKMVNGEPSVNGVGFNDNTTGGYLPVSFEGFKTPDAGSQPMFLTFDADEFAGGVDRLQIRTLTPNFVNPPASTLSAVTNLPTAAFDGRNPSPNAIEQQGTTVALDQLADRMMSRIIYRRFDNYESMVMNYVVNVSGVAPTSAATYQAGTRWYELTRPNSSSAWTINQQSTYSPTAISGTTGVNRWMGCPGIDQKGNIALGYSRSSSTNFPDIYYAERRKADPLNTLGIEQVFHASGGSQTTSGGRWGDYSAMTTDPSDEETLWYTAEYYASTVAVDFKTRVGSFKVTDPPTAPSVHFQKGGTIARQKESTTLLPPSTFYKDYPISLVIDQAPSQPVNITISKTGTATEGVDYDLLNTSALVLNGSTLTQSFTLRVYDDMVGEADEFIDIAYTLNFNGGNGIAADYNQKHRVTIIGKVVCPTANVSISGPTTFCQGGSVVLTANTDPAFTYQWYKNNTAISGETNAPYTATTSGTYKVDVTQLGCTIASAPIVVTVLPVVTPTVGTYSVCQNGAVPSGEGLVVTASTPTNTVNGSLVSGGGTYNRPTGNNITTYVASGVGTAVNFKTFTFVAPSSGSTTFFTSAAAFVPSDGDDTYLCLYQTSFNPASPATNFLRGDDDTGTNFLSSLTHTLVAGSTYVLVVSSFSNGETGPFALQASSNIFGQTIQWYLNASGGSPLATGSVFNPVGVSGSGIPNTSTIGTHTFHVADGAFPTCRTPVTFNIIGSVGGAVTADATVCAGVNSGTLNLTGHTGSVLRWESSTDNFASIITPISNTTTSHTYTNLSQTTQFRAVVKNGSCAEANSTAATITIGGALTAPTGTSNPTICSNTSASLSATCASGTVNWYDASSVAIPFVGSPYNTPNLSANTTYNVRCENGACMSPFVAVMVTVGGSLSAPTGTSNTSICGSGSASLSANCAAGNVVWYNAAGVMSLFTGSPFSTPSLSSNTSYKVRCENAGCLSSFVDVSVAVNPIPVITASADQTICAGSTVSLSATCNLLAVTATLSGASEVPGNSSTATGMVSGTFNPLTNDINLAVSFNGLSANASAGHIHNAAVGVNGPVIVGFTVPAVMTGSFTHNGVLTPTQASELLAGNTYVNIHNSTFPGGEIRGQLSATCIANTYVWNPGNLSGQSVMVSPSTSTVYTVTASNSTSGCSASATTMVTVAGAATASNTGPYTEGQTIQLSATGGTSYSWAGPNAFTSTMSNPTIASATLAMSGVYTVTVIQGACTSTATTNVVVSNVGPCPVIVDYDYVKAGNPFVYKFPLVNNMIIAQVPEETSIILSPVCPAVPIESFRMNLVGLANPHEIVESIAPFALFNNTGNAVLGRNLAPGNYVLTTTGYSQDNALGSVIYGPVVTNFTIVANSAMISAPTFTVTSLCAGSSFMVNFTTSGVFNPANMFEVQLSDESGSFGNPIVIGTAPTAGVVNCMVPFNMNPIGNAYRIRVVSTNQVVASNPQSGNGLLIHPNSRTLTSPTNDMINTNTTVQATQTITATNKVIAPSNVLYKAGNSILLSAGFQANQYSVFRAEIGGCN